MLALIERGEVKLPLEKAPLLARALRVDPSEVLPLALQQYWPDTEPLHDLLMCALSKEDAAILEVIRRFSGSRAPAMTPELEEKLRMVLMEATDQEQSTADIPALTEVVVERGPAPPVDAPTPAGDSMPEPTKHPMQDLNFKVDADFHRSFKTVAAVTGVPMKELLEAAFVHWLRQQHDPKMLRILLTLLEDREST